MNRKAKVSSAVDPSELKNRDVFEAKHFDESQFGGLIDPVIMLDHFRMTGSTFEPHPHAGISAVTYVFEDAIGSHYNYDSLGNHGPIRPGALHWFVAGSGAVHTEQPVGTDQCTHALQIFVNLPAAKKYVAPYVIHAEPDEIPELKMPGVRVRVVVGESNGVSAEHTAKLPEPFTILDGFLTSEEAFEHNLPYGWNAMIYVVSGKLKVQANGWASDLVASRAVGVSVSADQVAVETQVRLIPDGPAHFVVLSGEALNEPMVKHGPMVMSTMQQVEERISAYRNGDFGELALY